jgi:mannosyltransferase
MAEHRSNYSIVLIMLIGFVLRLISIRDSSLWLDEFTSIEIALQPLSDIILGTGFDKHTPPFYYIVLHLWFSQVQVSEFSLRFFSLLIDTFNIYLVYLVFSKQFTYQVGLLSSIYYSLSAYAIYYAQEGRMYTLLLCLVLLTYLIAIIYTKGRQSLFQSFFLILICTIGLYTHYYYAFSLIAITLGVSFYLSKTRKMLFKWYMCIGISCIAFAPWLKVVLELMVSEGQVFRKYIWSVLPYTLFRFSAGYAVFPLNVSERREYELSLINNLHIILPYMLVFIFVSIVSFHYLFKEKNQEMKLIVFPLILPALLSLIVSLKQPIISERYLIISFPFYICLISLFPLTSLRKDIKKFIQALIVILFVFALGMHYINEDFGKTEWREVAEEIREAKMRNNIVVVKPGYASGVLSFYLRDDYNIIPFREEMLLEEGLGRKFWFIENGLVTDTVNHFSLQNELINSFPLETGIRLYWMIDEN